MNEHRKEISALISLLDDSDSSVHQGVIERFIQLGAPVVNILEKYRENSDNELLERRIKDIVLQIQHSIARKDLKDWTDCHGDQLLYGAYLIARVQYPDLQYSELENSIEKLKSEIWLELNDHLTALEKIRVINHFLFSIHKFNRSIKGIQSPQLYFINHVLDTQKGLPITLALIYAEIATRLELPVYCVDIPQNFLLCYHDPTYSDDPDGILFYINPYAQGAVLSRAEVEFFLSEQQAENISEQMKPCSNIKTIERLSEGLKNAYSSSGMDEKAYFLNEIIEILRKGRLDYTL